MEKVIAIVPAAGAGKRLGLGINKAFAMLQGAPLLVHCLRMLERTELVERAVVVLAADEVGLVGLWFEGQKYFANTLPVGHCAQTTPILAEAKRWLDIYFAGKEPDFLPPLHPVGSSFQQSVWKILLTVPYGQTITYGDIARQLAAQQGGRVSAQAVGGAVGHNKVSIIIPCHRVVGANGSLTGYAGGIDKKIKLLELEHADMSRLFIPKKGAAL